MSTRCGAGCGCNGKVSLSFFRRCYCRNLLLIIELIALQRQRGPSQTNMYEPHANNKLSHFP